MNRVAAIDCGTNSIRLLIADISSGELKDVHREMRVVRLGQGVDATGEFASEALSRTFAAAEDYARLIQGAGVQLSEQAVRFVATSASRDARNREVFVEGIRQRLGVRPDVVAGTEEAQLSFAGASSVMAAATPRQTLVVDLGGGSTEFVSGVAGGAKSSVTNSISMNMGCVRFTGRYLHSDPPFDVEIAAACEAARELIAEAGTAVPFENVRRIIGVAGTVTTITAHALRLSEYQPEAIHGAELPIAKLVEAANDLLAMSREQRAALPYMHPGRVDVIGAGGLLWSTILEEVQSRSENELLTAWASEHDILDGIALSLG